MEDISNYVVFKFTNVVFIEIFGRYASNSEMAEFIAEDGSVTMKFKMINGVLDPPKTTEQFISLMYILFEANPKSPAGRIFASHQKEILRETVFRLQQMIDGFSDIHMTIHSECPNKDDPEKSDVKHTEYSLTRSKSVENE